LRLRAAGWRGLFPQASRPMCACVFTEFAFATRACRGLASDLPCVARMLDLELIRMLSPLGVGGLLACVIFIYYRLDFLRERQHHQAEHERQARREDRLLEVIERNAAASVRLAVTIESFARTLDRPDRRP
jgi:hypothetical protein